MIYSRKHPAFQSATDRAIERMMDNDRHKVPATAKEWQGKPWMTLDHCQKCQHRDCQHDMNCIECCPVARGEVTPNA